MCDVDATTALLEARGICTSIRLAAGHPVMAILQEIFLGQQELSVENGVHLEARFTGGRPPFTTDTTLSRALRDTPEWFTRCGDRLGPRLSAAATEFGDASGSGGIGRGRGGSKYRPAVEGPH